MRRLMLYALSFVPLIVIAIQQDPPLNSEQVFKDIRVLKGVPASEIIPAMEFMSASLKFECADCHDPKDYAADNRAKDTARKMIVMQREINAKNFNGQLEVTCMTCHGGKEHPAGTPLADGFNLRHARITSPPKPEELFAKHIAAIGKEPVVLLRTGLLTAPNDLTRKIESVPVELIQSPGGKFRLISGERRVVSDGTTIWYGEFALADEPAAIFGRIGRAWYGEKAFDGLERFAVSGSDMIAKTPVIVVRSRRPLTKSTEELYFESKSGLISRLINIRQSPLGAVVSGIDYSGYKSLAGTKVPMKVVISFADGSKWAMDFKNAKVENTANNDLFKVGK